MIRLARDGPADSVSRGQTLRRKRPEKIIFSVAELTTSSIGNLYPVYDDHTYIDRTLLWTVHARFGAPQNMISVIRQFHDGMRACVRLDDRVCSGWFAVEQGLGQGCVLAPLLFNIFFA